MKHTSICATFCALALMVIVGLAGCNKSDSASAGNGSGSSGGSAMASGPGMISGDGDRDAVKAVSDELAKCWLSTPEGLYSEFPSKTYIATGKRAGPESYYRQFKELKFRIDANDLSDSDKLNGISFRGNCDFDGAPVRVYGDPNAFGPVRWDDWHPSIENLTVQKKNGQWAVFSNGYLLSGTKPSPAMIAALK